MLLSLALSASAQIHIKQQINPEFQEKIKYQPSINADSCTAPYDLFGQFSPLGNDQYMIYLAWEMEPPDNGWLSWDDGDNFSGIGFACTGKFCAAVRWDSNQLSEYNGYKITKIKAYLFDDGYDSLTFRLCTGYEGSNHVYISEYLPPMADAWIEHELDTLIFLNSILEYWVGYGANIYGAGVFPLGTDQGPAIAGYGDKIKSCDSNIWDNLSDFGLSYNWNIQFYVEDSAGNEKQVGHRSTNEFLYLSGFNVYESINGGDYEFKEYFPYAPDTNYLGFQIDANPYERCYQLTAVWANPVDTCESLPATTKNNPDQNNVCFWLVGQHESDFEDQLIVRCQPNPFSLITTIEYQLDNQSEVNLSIFNYRGQLVYTLKEQQQEGKQKLEWDAEDLAAGLYFYRLEIGGKSAIGKLIKIKN
jgi:hypothetical protein